MIYDYPLPDEPIRQGDIFSGVPRIDISLENLAIVGPDSTTSVHAWKDLVDQDLREIAAVVAIRRVDAIVISQDCDNAHSRDISLCEIRPFKDVEGKSKDAKTAKSWTSLLTQQARLNLKWFYLPPDAKLGFEDKMAVDFRVTVRLARLELEGLRQLRKGRLSALADEHFRERLGEFFRRYPYDEWYPLSKDELVEYQKAYPDAIAFPWQR